MLGVNILLCVVLVTFGSVAAKQCDDTKRNLIRSGQKNANFEIDCIDPCDKTGRVFSNQTQCDSQKYCYWTGSACQMKYLNQRNNQQRRNGNKEVGKAFRARLKGEGITEQQSGQIEERSFPLGLALGGHNINSAFSFKSCFKFPYTCANLFNGNIDLLLEPPVNIPYCQRVSCGFQSNLDYDRLACHSVPGCYFDVELADLRIYWGQSVLPGVPVCYQAISNQNFHKLAVNYIETTGNKWNGLFTKCFIHENSEAILKNAPGCYVINALKYAKVLPKMAGWKDITEDECHYINACYFPKKGCFHPVLTDDAVRIGPSKYPYYDYFNSGVGLFGQPKCQFLNATVDPESYLESYHSCLKSGCSVVPKLEELTEYQLISLAKQYVPTYYLSHFIAEIKQGKVGADNWKDEIAKLIEDQQHYLNGIYGVNEENFPGFLFGNSYGTPLKAIQRSTTAPADGDENADSQDRTNTQDEASERSYVSPYEQVIKPPPYDAYADYQDPYPVYEAPKPKCPYRNYKVNNKYILKGSFVGCCEQNLCFTKREDVNQQFSGLFAYWASWQTWGDCSENCGRGEMKRKRRCAISNSELYCSGKDEEVKSCNEFPCSPWRSWDDWSVCTKECGGGSQTRHRQCYGSVCKGDSYEERVCNAAQCVVLAEWSAWSPCTESCGTGSSIRFRTCDDSNTTMSCPSPNSDKLVEVKDCEAYCGEILETGNSECEAFPSCLKTKSYVCQFVQDDGQVVEGNCKGFTPNKSFRCNTGFNCRWCGIFYSCGSPS